MILKFIDPYSILLILLSIFPLIFCRGCEKRKFSEESFVCVCNEEHCDELKTSINPSDSLIYSFTTNRDEHRFNQETYKLEDLTGQQVLSNSIKVSINGSHVKQTIFGFGGSFTDAATINIKSLPTDLSLTLLRDYFTSNGLDYNMGRVCIGGSDFSTRPYTYQDDYQDLDWKHFALAEEDLEYKLPIIKMANSLSGGLKLIGSMWSPPAWMKYQERINGIGLLKGDPGGPYYKAMADYMVRFLDEYKKNEVEFWGLTTLNEPSAGFKPGYAFNSLGLSPEMLTQWIAKDLGPALEAADYGKDKLKLMILDDNISMAFLYASRIFTYSNSSKYVSGIAVHWYENPYFGYDDFERVHKNYPDFFILSTEGCDGTTTGVKLGSWVRAEGYALDIIENLNHWGTGWIDWNLALDTSGGPNWVNNLVDSPIIINAEKREYYKQPIFYSLAHFTKFIKPGSTALGFTVSNADPNVRSTVVRNSDNQIVVVTLNKNDYAVNLTLSGVTKDPIGLTIDSHSIRTIVINTNSEQ